MLTKSAQDRIIQRIATAGVEKASECFAECLKFLELCTENPGKSFVPSKKVDHAWHEFILCTKEYTKYCRDFGSYIHHDPTDQPDEANYDATREALYKKFGELNSEVWPDAAAGSCTGSCESGSCKTLL